MCFELMDTPFPTQGNNRTLLSKHGGACGTLQRMRLFIQALMKFYASQSHVITSHVYQKIVYFRFQQHKCE